MNVLRESRSFARLLCALCLSFALVLSGVGVSADKGKFCAFECQKAYAVVPAVIPALGIAFAACGLSLTGIMAYRNLSFDDIVDAYENFSGSVKDFVIAMTTGTLELANVPVSQFLGVVDFANELMDNTLFEDGSVNFDDSFIDLLNIDEDQIHSLTEWNTQGYNAVQFIEREYANTWNTSQYPFSWDDWFAFWVDGNSSAYQLLIMPSSTSVPLTLSQAYSGYSSLKFPAHSYYATNGYSSYLNTEKWISISSVVLRDLDTRSLYWYGTVPASLGAIVGAGVNDSAVIPDSPVDPKKHKTAPELAAAAAAAAAASGAFVTQTDLDNASKAIENGGNPDISNLGQTAGTGEYTGILGQILNGILSIPRTIINTGADVISGIGEAVTSGVGTLVDTLADVIAKPLEAIKARLAPDEAVAIPSVWENFNQYLIFPLTIPADVLLLFDLIKQDGSAPKVTIKIAAPEWLNSKSFSAPAAGLSVVTHSGSNTADVTIDMQAYALLATFLRFALSMLWVFGLVNLVMRLVKVEENAVVGGSM